MEMENARGEIEVLYPRGRYDSALVPVDAAEDTAERPWGNLILDDELYEILGDMTRKGAMVVLISDSCHSGSVGKAVGDADSVAKLTTLNDIYGVKSYSEIKFGTPKDQRRGAVAPPEAGRYIVMSAAQDNESALDIKIGNTFGGLFVSTLARVLGEPAGNKLTYAQVLAKVQPIVRKESLDRDNDQNPVFDFTYGNGGSTVFGLPSGKAGGTTKGIK